MNNISALVIKLISQLIVSFDSHEYLGFPVLTMANRTIRGIHIQLCGHPGEAGVREDKNVQRNITRSENGAIIPSD